MSTCSEVVVIGAGLAGLSCAFELVERGHEVLVLEARDVVGGRTSSWVEDGMPVESGLHRFLGFFTGLVGLMERAGIDVDQAVCWEDEIEVRVPDGGPTGVFGLSLYHPARTLAGAVGNNYLVSPLDKASLVPFLVAGMRDYLRRPSWLDQLSVAALADRHGVRPRALQHLLVPLTAGTFFLPPERFSAYYFFGLFTPGMPRMYRMRLGAFEGGMTEVMTGPIAHAVEGMGGTVCTGTRVSELLRDGDRITGVRTADGSIAAEHVVLATAVSAAQELIGGALGDHPWFDAFLRMPTTPSATVQLELDTPAMDVDRTAFGPGTALACFAEQSRTTFKHAPGRMSIILSPPERYVGMSSDQLLEVVLSEAARLRMDLSGHVTAHRVAHLPGDFHCLEPGYAHLRATQATPIPGLTLAGDHTQQRFVASMEGAVVSGKRAAEAVHGGRL